MSGFPKPEWFSQGVVKLLLAGASVTVVYWSIRHGLETTYFPYFSLINYQRRHHRTSSGFWNTGSFYDFFCNFFSYSFFFFTFLWMLLSWCYCGFLLYMCVLGQIYFSTVVEYHAVGTIVFVNLCQGSQRSNMLVNPIFALMKVRYHWIVICTLSWISHGACLSTCNK